MKLNIKDKTIDVDRNIEITKEEIAKLIFVEESIEPVTYILDQIGLNFICSFGAVIDFIASELVCRLDSPARLFFEIIADKIKEEEEAEKALLKS